MHISIVFGLLAAALSSTSGQEGFSVSLKKSKVPKNLQKFGLNLRSKNRIWTKEQGFLNINALDSATFNVGLTNDMDLQYTGPIYVGTPENSGMVTYDTGSGDFTITSTLCSSCETQVYDPTSSSTAEDLGTTGQIEYGDCILYGDYYTDDVCLNEDSGCVTDFQVFAIYDQVDLGEDEGILGLSPEYTDNESIVYTLYNQGVIPELVVGLLIGNTNQDSTIMFGGYNSSQMLSDPIYFPLISTMWWHIDISQAAYGGTSFMTSGSTCIIDSGTSMLSMPVDDFIELVNMINDDKQITCDEGWCFWDKSCDKIYDSLQNLTFSFGTSDVFTLTPQQYLIDGSEFGEKKTCYIGLDGDDSDGQYIFGDTFLRYYYSVYDFENLQVGLAPSIYNGGEQLLVALALMIGLFMA